MSEPRTVVVQMPYPPSANRLWRAVNGRQIKSQDYRVWTDNAVALVRAQLGNFRTIAGHYHLLIKATRPDNRRRDLGNLEKPLSDALVAAGVVADDCNAQHINIFWSSETIKGGGIEVTVKEAA